MNLLLDTHLLIWGATADKRLPPRARELINDADNKLWFSSASIWETTIKAMLNRTDFRYDVGQLRAGLLANGYNELAVEGRHAVTYRDVPALHRDPFDRLLVAQAISEGMRLLTADRALGEYGQSVLAV
jgi:PIN domain nuclease of toxin-antitoxin system